VDAYPGAVVRDPYRWLEDVDAPETRAWMEAQNRVTEAYFQRVPERELLRIRLRQLWNYERFGVPIREGDRYFYTRNDGLQNQSVIYSLASLDSVPEVVLDPNTLSADGTVALTTFQVSPDGRRLAYGLATAGSDWQEWKVRDVGTKEDLADHLQWIKFSTVSWTPDNQGFFYSRYDEPRGEGRLTAPNHYQKLYYHRLGTPQAEDRLVYDRPDQKEWGFRGSVTDSGHHLILHVTQGTERRNRLYYQDLRLPGSPVVELLNDFDAAYTFIDHEGPVFWVLTDQGAERGRVIAVDITRPQREFWREIIPEGEDNLRGVAVVNDEFLANYLHHARSRVQRFTLEGRPLGEIAVPGLVSVGGFTGRRRDQETFYSVTSFTQPGTVYRHDFVTGRSLELWKPAAPFRSEDYVTEQVFCQSKDGTRVPLFLTCRRGMVRNGRAPVYLYGYGGFRIPLTPSFSPGMIAWLEMGGIYAVANLRGGGEYGTAWHQAGTKLQKQNVFDDFIAAAEWLVAERYTRPDRLAIAGGSNGGLLVGACLVQRPELFGAVLPAVGVLDMLRFHRFTIGWAWTSDYGSPEDPAEFRALYAYSPLHNLQVGTRYPSTLITTGDHDDRVVPAHSFKFAAALQAAHRGKHPVLLRVETRAGHGAGKPTTKVIEETADRLAFLVHEFRMQPPDWP
jgi:prolyl oligopeptidase